MDLPCQRGKKGEEMLHKTKGDRGLNLLLPTISFLK